MREEYKLEFLHRDFRLHFSVTSLNERHHWWECLAHGPVGEIVPELNRTPLEPCYSECDRPMDQELIHMH